MARFLLALFIVMLCPGSGDSFVSETDLAGLQAGLEGKPVGERIAFWAESFVGTPYDPDPLGEYVTRKAIVADQRVDCMYHTFRSAELALSKTPEEAVALALRMRFKTAGVIKDGEVLNYDDRFQYAADMLASGRWGTEVTDNLGQVETIEGARGYGEVGMLPRANIAEAAKGMESGDIVFFVKDPSKRVVGEIIGHIGIIKREGEDVYLIHASGLKNRGGVVKKVLLGDYALEMPFVGIRVSRFGGG